MKLKKQFSASVRWIKNFRQVHQTCLRKPHLRRRQAPDHEAVAKFITELTDTMKQMDHRYIVNANETSWRIILTRPKTRFPKNHQKSLHHDVVAEMNDDPKGCFTVIAVINAIGEQLPLFMLAKEITKRCEKQLTAHDDNQIFHSGNG
jgi:hypothetical protein